MRDSKDAPPHSTRRRSRTILLLLSLLSCLIVLRRRFFVANDVCVCIVGNAETAVSATRVFEQWAGAFPTTYYLWGNGSEPYRRANLDAFTLPGEILSFAEGIHITAQKALSTYACDYIFTHDDDLTFYVQGSRKGPDVPVHAELSSLLNLYRPAIAGFPWDVGDSRFPAMTELKRRFSSQQVAPLTGFDNGMVLYHRDVIDFFLPFAPRGEGGFHGKWTLGAHYLQMFGPLVFAEHALRLNTVRYNNTINMDNQPIHEGEIRIVDGMAHVPWSRHPYEWPQNEAYMSFLKSGIKDPQTRWGRSLEEGDVRVPQKRISQRYPAHWIIERLASAYDLRHPALSSNVLLQSFFR